MKGNAIITAGILVTATISMDGSNAPGSFGEDLAFLTEYTETVVLSDKSGRGRAAVAPAWQGRVMTSTANGDDGDSYGWINREQIASGKLQPHINIFGGEDRFWLGPEGGQFSIFFAKGAKFELADWYTPAAIDTMPYKLLQQTRERATFVAEFQLTNYSGTRFDVSVRRELRMLEPDMAWKKLGTRPDKGVNIVAYESDNRITNTGKNAWKKETGLLSIWILGMFNPSSSTTIVVPIKAGTESKLGPRVTSDYFGKVPPERLIVKENVIYFRGDGLFRSKIGINPRRSRAVLGSYDPARHVLTIVQFSQPKGVTDYVNSLWKLQEDPYSGDAANSYNDGPATLGAKPFGPFYELESSSPAAALGPGKSLEHVHRMIHLSGPEAELDGVARANLGVSLDDIRNAFRGQ